MSGLCLHWEDSSAGRQASSTCAGPQNLHEKLHAADMPLMPALPVVKEAETRDSGWLSGQLVWSIGHRGTHKGNPVSAKGKTPSAQSGRPELVPKKLPSDFTHMNVHTHEHAHMLNNIKAEM